MLTILALLSLFNWLPKIGYVPLWEDPITNLSVTIWPAASVGYRYAAVATRMMRSSLLEVMREDYIRTARAKGAPVWRHAFKEGFLIPVTEIMSAKIPFLLGGAVIVEQVFNWPGMGRMAWQAAQDRDFPVIMGIALVAAAFVRTGNLLQRVVFTMVNPRASKE
jgi:peptide/nickel transport system permease protein